MALTPSVPRATGSAAGARVVKVGLPGSINELDPRKAVDYVSGIVLDQIFDTPYAPPAVEGPAEPRLFEPLRAEDGKKGQQYSAAVRPGVLFSDGTPLTAELAARSLRTVAILAGKTTIEARGDRVWFSLATPNPRFDLTLTQSNCCIVLDKDHQLLGTGPYRFEERANLVQMQRSERLRLVRNPHHHGTAKLDGIEFHVLPPDGDGTPKRLVEALRSGTIDLTTALSASDLVTFQISGVAPVTRPSNSTAFLYFNTSRRPFDQALARRGAAASIHPLEIASRCYDRNPAAFVATSVLPPSMSRSIGIVRTQPADRAKWVEQSGLRGAHLSLLVPWCPRPYLPKPAAVAQSIRQQLSDLGAVVSVVDTHSSDEYFKYLSGGMFDLALGGWIADTADPADFFEALLFSRGVGNANFANNSRWSNRATDSLLERFRVDPTDAHRQEIERLIADEVPFLPLVYGHASAVHSRHVRNVTLTASGSIALANVVMN